MPMSGSGIVLQKAVKNRDQDRELPCREIASIQPLPYKERQEYILQMQAAPGCLKRRRN